MKYIFLFPFIIITSFSTAQEVSLFMPEKVNTHLNERDFAISPVGDEIMFTRSTVDNKYRVIVHMMKIEKGWSEPEIVPFSGNFNDLEPFYSPDGQKLFFASNRTEDQSSQKKDYDIWYAQKEYGLWANPVRLDTSINTHGNEFYPSVASNGNLYFTGERSDSKGTEDIYVSNFKDGKYQTPVSLSENINTKNYEYNAFISPNEKLLIFGSYGRMDDMGGGDLYYSIKNEAGEWQESIHFVENINSNDLDYCPFYDIQNEVLYFTSNRKTEPNGFETLKKLHEYSESILSGAGNIYFGKWSFIELK